MLEKYPYGLNFYNNEEYVSSVYFFFFYTQKRLIWPTIKHVKTIELNTKKKKTRNVTFKHANILDEKRLLFSFQEIANNMNI